VPDNGVEKNGDNMINGSSKDWLISIHPKKGVGNMAKRIKKGTWTNDDLKVLKGNFKDQRTSEIAKELGRPVDAVKKKASRMGLRKSRRHMRTLGRES
jgi:hypothetical protein